jgi:hypothetical protein
VKNEERNLPPEESLILEINQLASPCSEAIVGVEHSRQTGDSSPTRIRPRGCVSRIWCVPDTDTLGIRIWSHYLNLDTGVAGYVYPVRLGRLWTLDTAQQSIWPI